MNALQWAYSRSSSSCGHSFYPKHAPARAVAVNQQLRAQLAVERELATLWERTASTLADELHRHSLASGQPVQLHVLSELHAATVSNLRLKVSRRCGTDPTPAIEHQSSWSEMQGLSFHDIHTSSASPGVCVAACASQSRLVPLPPTCT